MTKYIAAISAIRHNVTVNIQVNLSAVMSSQQIRLTGYSAAMAVATISCLALTVWYANRTHRMIGDMAKHARHIQLKSHELALEKRRSDALL